MRPPSEAGLDPAEADEPDPPVLASEEGDEGMIVFGALYGAYVGAEAGWLLGEALEATEDAHQTAGIWPGLLGGGAIGLGTGYLLSLSRDLDGPAEALLYTTAGHGMFYGLQAGRALIPPGDPGRNERIHAAGLGGSMLGLGAGVALADSAAPASDQLWFSLASGIGWIAGTGLSDLAQLGLVVDDVDQDGIPEWHRWDPRPRAGLLIGSTALLGGVGVLANQVQARPGPASLGLSIGHGAWIGGWSPLLFSDSPSPREVTGGLRLGLGLGYGSALALSSLGEPDGRSVGMQVAGWGAASALGAGIPLSLAGEGSAATVVGPMLAAGVGGQILGGLLAPHYELEPADGLLLGSLGAWTTYQAIGWGWYASFTTEEPRRPLGYALSAGGAGSLVALSLTPLLDVSPAGSLLLLSSGGWGTWYGGWLSQLSGMPPEGRWLTTLAAGNGTLLASGVAQAAGWRPGWLDVAAIDGVGLMGAAAGGLVGVVFLYDPDDWDPLVLSTVAGSTVGLAIGGYVAAKNDDASLSLSLPRLAGRWRPSVAALPLAGEDGSQGAYVRLDLREVPR